MAVKALDGAPELDDQAALYFAAWTATSTSRNTAGMSVGSIPYPVITSWGRDHGVDDLDDLELLVWGVQAIDLEFLDHLQKTKGKPGQGHGKGKE